ncbi:hypothetical protein [Paracidovorax oryzae]|uniref:hypothetical protein n=1 Tax=Paracidovorax oryzae TaxID=862720 RepID=UPI0012EBF4DC|nr:hypothetical protein [Paracidovorax oryzae]
MITLIIAVFGFPILIFLYILLNAFLAATLWRNRAKTWRKLFIFFTNQLCALSANRIWTTVLAHAVAGGILFYSITRPQEILWITLILLGYVFLVSTLTLSLFMKLPYFQQLWGDTFFKVCLLATPILLHYLAKGYAALWIGQILKISATNVPMAHFAATSFFLLLAVALLLSATAILFEFSFIFFTPSNKRFHLDSRGTSTLLLLFSLQPYRRRSERLRVRAAQRKVGIFLLLIASFLGTAVGFYAAASIAPGRLSSIVVSAIVFEFDAAPADRCTLTTEERLKVMRDEPLIKALFLAGTQDKAILVERQKNLFAPIQFQGFRAKADLERELMLQRATACNVLD